MDVQNLIDDSGEVYAFEISSLYGRRAACRVAASIPGSIVLKRPKLFSLFGDEIFCEFQINDINFQIWEPFNDNSKYWIGPHPVKSVDNLALVRGYYERANMLGWIKNGS